jgi:hypothetical protein
MKEIWADDQADCASLMRLALFGCGARQERYDRRIRLIDRE